ncbi:MAG TPA: CtsR family transcriptional regulator [Clostridiaceae bacterium]|nr:CtsR family transcriptional regulator [Clostridiaceae bacterium]
MSNLSDLIEEFIKGLLDDNDPEHVEIQRNELANYFNCVPSQINYVIDTRFSPEKGYYVESRRGGGGYIKICRIRFDKDKNKDHYTMHVIGGMGKSLSQYHCQIFIRNFLEYEIITEREARIMEAATSDKILKFLPTVERDKVRASLLRNMLTSLLTQRGD